MEAAVTHIAPKEPLGFFSGSVAVEPGFAGDTLVPTVGSSSLSMPQVLQSSSTTATGAPFSRSGFGGEAASLVAEDMFL